MRTRDEVRDHVRRMIEEVSLGRVRAADVRSDSRLLDDLGLDSLDYATVLLATERWLGVRIAERDVDWRAMATVDQIAALLLRRDGR